MTEAIEQGSAEWFAIRAGKVTASRMSDVMAKGAAGKPSATRANYMAQLLCERLTGLVEEGYKSADMVRGTELEPQARKAYAFMKNVDVEQVGFVDHPRIPMCGCSPDGLVGESGLVEIKVPKAATHLESLLGGTIDGGYNKQAQWQMAVTGRQWVDLVSYSPSFPVHLQLHIRRIPRDQTFILGMEAEAVTFLRELDAKVAQLKNIGKAA